MSDPQTHVQPHRPPSSGRPPEPNVPELESNEGLPTAFVNSLGMKLVLIPSGDVFLGDPPSKQVFRPIKVRFTRPYYAGVYKVTQAEYKAVMGSNPSMFGGRPQNPVERVTFADAIAFCKKLSDREGLPYALPTEGQWERLCRADTTTRWYFGNDGSELGQHAWFAENSGWRPHKVGLKKANPFGIYDVYGDVYEWCEDGYIRGEAQPYDHKAELLGVSVDPRGHPGKLEAFNVIRGGSFLCPADRCRTTRHDERPVRTAPQRHRLAGDRRGRRSKELLGQRLGQWQLSARGPRLTVLGRGYHTQDHYQFHRYETGLDSCGRVRHGIGCRRGRVLV